MSTNSNEMYKDGHRYYLGIEVEMDKHKAFTYYLKSAEAGNSMGIFKTAICYYYGVGVAEDKNKYEYWIKKDYQNGKCIHCNKDNTSEAWCQTCDPDITIQEWTSENEDIDYVMKEFQLKANTYDCVIEFISFNRLDNIKEIGKGGFSTVFSATWLDGIRKIDNDDYGNRIRARKQSSVVALKTLSSSEKTPLCFLKEFINHMKCTMIGSRLKIYGLTQNPRTNEYLMVFQYTNSGNLHKFLKERFQDLTWQTKLKLLHDISSDLKDIHYAGYIHADFHSGNILQDQHFNVSGNIQSYISDLGLSKNSDENTSIVYGVMPYIAPEVLRGGKFTKAADIYSFGVIMSEMSTGQRPFDGYEFGTELSVKICNGLRPEFVNGTPDCYIELANQCLNSDPEKRPNAQEVYNKLSTWNNIMKCSDNVNEIKKQFLSADKFIEKLPIIERKHQDSMYTSKIINTSQIKDSKQLDLKISDISIEDDD
ncbi:kinase-like domain-containing protein [Gigaspora rosea]|uniref:Kinase-like domain-containing protein n=1 Tax=Gigaspora rosea TaxID=44941 RepID=A0A397VRH2_9GLOM|nr:kinase-like domain-containing protein [Gigaspora rosea]